MSRFVSIIVGGLELAAVAVIGVVSGGIGFAALGAVWAPIVGALLSSGTGMLLSGVGTLVSSAVGGSPVTGGSGGITVATRNPIKPWDIIYGRCCVGSRFVQVNDAEQSA